MRHKCIKCGSVWGSGTEEEFYSHGICRACFIELFINKYHQEQLQYSGNPCFAKATDVCEHDDCKYWDVCCEEFLN